MKVLAFTSHSKNNEQLYNATIKNHIDYFNRYDISYLSHVDVYNKFVDVDMIRNLLNIYDLVFSVGSDVLFTHPEKSIFDFIDLNKNINICEEGLGVSLTNGEIVFYKNGSQDFLKVLDLIQKANPDAWFGTQSVFNALFEQQNNYAQHHINLIPAGTLQSFLLTDGDLIRRKEGIGDKINKVLWTPDSFICHAVGGDNNEKTQRINEIKQKYNFQ